MTSAPIEDLAGFVSFYKAEFRPTVRSVGSILGVNAEDVAQEAFMAAYARWDLVSQLDEPGAWVRLVAKRMAWRRSRRELQRPLKERVNLPPFRWDSNEDLDLPRAIESLPARMRAAIELHHLADMPVREVAATLGCGESAAKVLIHRARHSLAEALGGHRGRWTTDNRWTADDVARQLEAQGTSIYLEVVLDEVTTGERWVFRLDGGCYLLESETGERMDHGRYRVKGAALELVPWNESGVVILGLQIDGDKARFAVRDNTTAPTRGVPDSVYLNLLLGSDSFIWSGREV